MAKCVGDLTLKCIETGSTKHVELQDSWAREQLESKLSKHESNSVSLDMLDEELLDLIEKETSIDSSLSDTSLNPVQNKVIKKALDSKANANHTHSEATESLPGMMSAADKRKLSQLQQSISDLSEDLSGTKDELSDAKTDISEIITGLENKFPLDNASFVNYVTEGVLPSGN